MKLGADTMKPIYIQIAEWIETQIVAGSLGSDGRVYSQYQLAEMFTINPATAAKGLTALADEGILYKKRGLGMFVTPHAVAIIMRKRRDKRLKQLVLELVLEAQRLNVQESELAAMIVEARSSLEGGV